MDWVQDQLLLWYREFGRSFPWRRARATQFLRILSEALLQRTTATAVAAFLPGFVARYPRWKAIAEADTRELEAALKPLGLWKIRAPRLRELALVMASRNGRLPRNRAEAEALPGVGQYIANAMLLFGGAEPAPLLDTNMARVLERVFGARTRADIRYDPYLQTLSRQVVARDPKRLNWAILDLGALVCRPARPRCSDCPLSPACQYARHQGNGEKFPEGEIRQPLRSK